jgi:S1-C subfamily serine protease
MAIQTTCPECGSRFTLADLPAGRKARCPECRAAFEAPGRRRESPDEEGPRSTRRATREAGVSGTNRRRDEEDEGRPSRPARRRPKAASSGAPLWWLLGSSAVLLLLVLGVVVTLAQMGKRTETWVGAPSNPPISGPVGAPIGPLGDVPPAGNAPPPGDFPPPGFPPVDSAFPDEDNLAVENPDPPAAKLPAHPPAARDGELSREAMAAVKRGTVYLRVTTAEGDASGTGFFGDPSAPSIVLTNAHVVGMLSPDSPRPSKIEVVLHSGEKDEKTLAAKVLAIDRSSDLAVLDVGAAAGLPKPLTVKPADAVRELDKVYTFGFPLGERLGKEITIRPSSVSSLRKRGGVLDRIQVNGGMDPGNSGGPVVDGAGHVVGVAVSGVAGRDIKFAIPGERVRALLHGRVAGGGIGPAFEEGGKTVVPVAIEMIDPRRQVKEVALELWTGDPPARGVRSRPPALAAPAAQPGDSPKQRFLLRLADGVARGRVALPTLPPGKAYWVRPTWVRATGEGVWCSASVHQVGAPLRRKEVTLRDRWVAGQTARSVLLSVVNRLRLGGDDDSEVAAVTTQAAFDEHVPSASPTAGVLLSLPYRNAAHTVVLSKKPTPSPLLGVVRGSLGLMTAEVQLDASGAVTMSRLKVSRPPAGMENLVEFHEALKAGLEGALLPLPNKTVAPGQTWKLARSVNVEARNDGRRMPLDLTCTYLGVRDSGGREEAVVTLRGSSGDAEGGGKARGLIIVDVASGTVRRVALDVDAELPSVGVVLGGEIHKLKARSLLSIRLERSSS